MHYHIVGIAGAGMSAIAHVLLDQGHTVSGSDLATNRLTAGLVARGAAVRAGHHANTVRGADAVLATAAVRPDHVEVQAARAAGIPVVSRLDLWREWSAQRPVVAVAGTHGKTTTSAMIALALVQAGCDPGFLIGGEPADLPTNARWGDPAAPLVIEADEYAHAFLALTPQVAVITNIEWDHPDIYPTEAAYHAAFVQFAAQTQQTLLVSEQADALVPGAAEHRWMFGFGATCDYRLDPDDGGQVSRRGELLVEALPLAVPGQHNRRNALAALAVADQLGVELAPVVAALGRFGGTARRFEWKGERDGVTVIDDYAHHPTEVRATLAAARQRYGSRRIVAYLQPHTFSRTTALSAHWPTAFADADVVLVGNVYAAREQGDAAAVAQQLAERIAMVHGDTRAVGDLAAATAALHTLVQPGDVVLTLGAGDGDKIGMALLEPAEVAQR